jgi:hypothetical protein
MIGVDTSAERPAPLAVRVVELTRRQLLVLALLACVPLPVLSIATTAAPLPEIVQRAAAGLVPFSPAERNTKDVRERVEPQSRGRRALAKRSTAPAGISRASSPSTQASTGKPRTSSVQNRPGRAAPSVAVTPTRSGGDTSAGQSGATKPTLPNTLVQSAPVQEPSPQAHPSDGKKGKGKQGDKVSPGATKTKNETATNGQTKPPGGDEGNGQKTGQGSGGKAGDKSKP